MRFIFTILFFIFSICFQAQNNEDILFTVDNDPTYSSEFIRVFNKNLDLKQLINDLKKYL